MTARRTEGAIRSAAFEYLETDPDVFSRDIDVRPVYRARKPSDDQEVVAQAVLVVARHMQSEVSGLIDEAVALARSNGVSWAQIGKCLKISQQAASARFGQKVGR